MKLLLDEMFSAVIAKRLRDGHGHDVVAVTERDEFRGLQDTDIFFAAQDQQRTIVTENVRDFLPIAREWQAMGRLHFGIVLTTNRRFPRAHSRTAGSLVRVLSELIDATGHLPASNREIWL